MDKKTEVNSFTKTAKRKFYNHKDSGNAFLLGVICPYIMAFLTLLVALVVAGAGADPNEISSSLAVTIISCVLTPLTFFTIFMVYNKSKKISFSASQVRFNLNWKTILILISISLVCVFGLQYLIGGFDLGLKALGYKFSEIGLPLTNGWWYVLNLVLLAFLPAVCEELIFRGIIFNGLRRNMKDIWAVVLSAGLFMIMHGSLEQFIYPFILGIILAWIVLRTGSVVASIIVHFVNNTIVITLGFIENMTGFSFTPSQNWLFWTLAVVLALVTFAILYIIDRFFFKKKNKLETEKVDISTDEGKLEGKIPSITLAVGIAIAIVLFIVNTVMSF